MSAADANKTIATDGETSEESDTIVEFESVIHLDENGVPRLKTGEGLFNLFG